MEYTIRKLNSNDIFLMVSILSKIGISEISSMFEGDELKEVITEANRKKAEADQEGTDQKEDAEQNSNNDLVTRIGMKVIFKIVNLLMKNLPKCKKELFEFLSEMSGIPAKEISELPPADTMGMLIDIFKQDEFMDFIQVVSKLFK